MVLVLLNARSIIKAHIPTGGSRDQMGQVPTGAARDQMGQAPTGGARDQMGQAPTIGARDQMGQANSGEMSGSRTGQVVRADPQAKVGTQAGEQEARAEAATPGTLCQELPDLPTGRPCLRPAMFVRRGRTDKRTGPLAAVMEAPSSSCPAPNSWCSACLCGEAI